MPPHRTAAAAHAFRIANLTNRLDGTLALLNDARMRLSETDAQIHSRAAQRAELVRGVRGDPDRKDHADRDGRIFRLEMARFGACAEGLRTSLREWEGEVEVLRRLLERAGGER